jgi:subtilisin family serine protease
MSRRTANYAAIVALALTSLGASTPAAPATGSVRLVVAYAHHGPAAALERHVGATMAASIPQLRVDVVRVAPERVAATLRALRASPAVRYAERDSAVRALRVPNDQLWPTQWSAFTTGAPAAWDLTTGSSRVVVAVVDTGVAGDHPDLAGKLVPGYNFVAGKADASDDNGHGTAVGGIIAAESDNRIGVAGYCWACRVMPVKVLAADGTGFASAVAQGVVWAADHGAKVINASLGGPEDDATLSAAAQYASAHGALLVAAAGNDGSALLEYPAALPGVLSVGASDRKDRLYSFSNSGAAVAAPGENTTTGSDRGYVSFLGTSSAAPVVSGIAALALSAAPQATPTDLTHAIESSAVPMPGVRFGRVNAYGTVHALAPVLSQPKPGSRRASRVRILRGRLGRARRVLSVATGAGVLRAMLKLRGATNRPTTLAAWQGRRLLAARHGRTEVQVRVRVRRGRCRLVISPGNPGLSFVLALRYPSSG